MHYSVLLVAAACVAVVYGQDGTFSRADYPNPQTEPLACGRDKRSWLCDPSNILTKDQANQIDMQLEKFYNQTTCPCSDLACKERPGGYRIAVAIVEKMGVSQRDRNRESNSGDEVYLNLHRARLFAYTLKSMWNMERCEDGILVFFSLSDNVLYTMVGDSVIQQLGGYRIGEIAMEHRMKLGPNRNNFSGLQAIINDYRAVLFNQYKGLPNQEAKPRYAAVVMEGSSSSASISGLPVYLILSLSALLKLAF